ncbi:MAG: hypothetical protein KIS66_17745 [Fimbriimonadaceae bacterium]|nr:hypothetical protein [Fimbriimonadaceae bacterium]
MDEFDSDRLELTASLIAFEFGPGGRIQQLWVTDPELPEEAEEFQFILPPMPFGEEYAEDYYPGTVLIGARNHPDDPWVFDRNKTAFPIESDDAASTGFTYDFALLPEIRATGRYFEQPGAMPVVIWALSLENRSNKSLEIGELALPMAFHNLLDGGGSPDAARKVFRNRYYIHKALGGSASYVHVQRISGEPPGLLVYPGENTAWEMVSSVPATVNAPHAWEGIPVVYLYSSAAVDREGRFRWFNGHSSLVLEPGETRVFQTRFVPVDQRAAQDLPEYLEFLNQPSVRLFPGAIAPVDVGIAVEVSGTIVRDFSADREAEIETDTDENGGFCFVRPTTPGSLRVTFSDGQGRDGHTHLLFLEPIRDLIEKRAGWLVAHQVFREDGHALNGSFVSANNSPRDVLTDPEWFLSDYAVYCGLGEALFLAEKNAAFPKRDEIELLEKYVTEFLHATLQNPGSCAVGCEFQSSTSVATDYGDPEMYVRVALFYLSMARIAHTTGLLSWPFESWLSLCARTITAMFANADPNRLERSGLPLFPLLHDLFQLSNYVEEAPWLEGLVQPLVQRLERLAILEYDFRDGRDWSSEPFEDLYNAAVFTKNRNTQDKLVRCATAAKGLGPSWWWFGVDKALFEGVNPQPKLIDNGELGITAPTVANSAMLLNLFTRDIRFVPKHVLRAAYGGMLAAWSLVGPEGQSAAAFCPDPSSRMAGMLPFTGDTGATLYLYLRHIASYLLRGQSGEALPYGCSYDADDESYTLRPWDGLGQRVVLGLTGVRFETTFGTIAEVRVDRRKRWAKLILSNPTRVRGTARVRIEGLWGAEFVVNGTEFAAEEGVLAWEQSLGPNATERLEVRVRNG